MNNFTIIGYCQNIADKLQAESERWTALANAMGIAYQKLSNEDKALVQQLLNRIPVEAGEPTS